MRLSVYVSVCLSVTTLAATSLASTLKMGFILGFSRFLTRGFSIKASIQKSSHEKANMQMSMYSVLACFEYCACISRYLKGEHWVSDQFLARFAHRGRCYGINH